MRACGRVVWRRQGEGLRLVAVQGWVVAGVADVLERRGAGESGLVVAGIMVPGSSGANLAASAEGWCEW